MAISASCRPPNPSIMRLPLPFQNARFAAAPITISVSRQMAVTFTESFMQIGKTILYKRPSAGEAPFSNVQELSNQTKVPSKPSAVL